MNKKESSLPPHIRALLVLIWPPIIGILAQFLLADRLDETFSFAPLLAGIGVVSWLLGVRWYGIQGMGLRGGRPLMSGFGFAFLGWLAILLARVLFVDFVETASGGLFRTYIYLFLFEAFCIQLWAFGVFFHSVAEWRGGLASAILSGILFGLVGYLVFIEAQLSYGTTWLAIPFFLVWGIFYGIIRLRTGSWVGTALIQSLQTLTAWYLIIPKDSPPPIEMNLFYGLSIILLAGLIWRLWPRSVEDYRI
jgi:hypothetical protein